MVSTNWLKSTAACLSIHEARATHTNNPLNNHSLIGTGRNSVQLFQVKQYLHIMTIIQHITVV